MIICLLCAIECISQGAFSYCSTLARHHHNAFAGNPRSASEVIPSKPPAAKASPSYSRSSTHVPLLFSYTQYKLIVLTACVYSSKNKVSLPRTAPRRQPTKSHPPQTDPPPIRRGALSTPKERQSTRRSFLFCL